MTNQYVYNAASLRTKQTRTDASYVNYGYDNYGQLQTALGYTSGGTPITSEQFGYAYDAAWNLLRLTNNGSVTTRSYNSLNQLPSPPYGDYTYDANGNLTAIGSRTFTYDDENQLVVVRPVKLFRNRPYPSPLIVQVVMERMIIQAQPVRTAKNSTINSPLNRRSLVFWFICFPSAQRAASHSATLSS